MKITLGLLSLVIGLPMAFAGEQSASELHRSISPEPRLQSYSWMSLARWFRMHAEDVELAEAGEYPLLFVGDSITEGWGENLYWKKHFAPRGAINFGIGGDMTQNLLWRFDNGSTGNLNPKAIVLLIGINNLGFIEGVDTGEVAEGILSNIDMLLERFPEAELLWMNVFPSGEKPDHPWRGLVADINAQVGEAVASNARVTSLSLWDRFVDEQGLISAELMPDFLHLSEDSYGIWAEAVLPWVEERVPVGKP